MSKGWYACRHKCGAMFGNLLSLREHEDIPHEQCSVCKGFFRHLVKHQLASRLSGNRRRCWVELKVKR